MTPPPKRGLLSEARRTVQCADPGRPCGGTLPRSVWRIPAPSPPTIPGRPGSLIPPSVSVSPRDGAAQSAGSGGLCSSAPRVSRAHCGQLASRAAVRAVRSLVRSHPSQATSRRAVLFQLSASRGSQLRPHMPGQQIYEKLDASGDCLDVGVAARYGSRLAAGL